MSKETQTVEQTGKIWKLLQLIGGLIAVVCLSIFFGASYSIPMALLGCLGVGLMVVGRLGAWWFHG